MSKKKQKRDDTPADKMVLTVGVAPSMAGPTRPSLECELRLVRSALLYADKVELLAPSAVYIEAFRPLLAITPAFVLNGVARLPDRVLADLGVEDVTPVQFRQTIRQIAALPVHHPQRREAERLWRQQLPEIQQLAASMTDTRESDELAEAMETGSVRMVGDGLYHSDPVDKQIKWFSDRLHAALSRPSSHVLMDDPSTQLVRNSGLYAEGLPGVMDRRTQSAALGTGLVSRLPVFPDAPMSDILEVREDLSEARGAYRLAMRNMAASLVSHALDPCLPSEVNDRWCDEVEPALDQLRKTVSVSRVAQGMGGRLLTEGFGIPTVVVGLANVPDLIAALPPPAAVATGVGRIVAAGMKEALERRRQVRQHDLVYLLNVERRLKA